QMRSHMRLLPDEHEDELHRLVVQCLEVDGVLRDGERRDDVLQGVGLAVRNGEAMPHACAHQLFTLQNRRAHTLDIEHVGGGGEVDRNVLFFENGRDMHTRRCSKVMKLSCQTYENYVAMTLPLREAGPGD